MALAGVFLLTMSSKFEKEIGYEWLTMFLNCPIALFYFDMIYSKLDNTGWQWKKEPIEKLPVPLLKKEKQAKLLDLFNSLKDKKLDKNRQIALISLEIYKMFGFSSDEIKAIYDRTIIFDNEYAIIKEFLRTN